ncbi:class I SAM-dependent methyltransferase [Bauldia sp.]|uniref:class I SAM-dependent methyltransferase n=1 Tax=Bauldia sp. TaxID=2575872 RepID=UPI003BAD9E00
MTSHTDRVEPGEAGTSRPLWRKLAESWASSCTHGQVTLVFPDGDAVVFKGTEPGPAATMRLHNGKPVWKMISRGDLGFAEAYMDDDWSTPDLTALVEFGVRNENALAGRLTASWLVRLVSSMQFRLRANSRSGAKRNIAFHYDLGNAFYRAWLDETMTYSSALFASDRLSLSAAQEAKYRRIIETLDIGPNDRVLEIGCGWGGFAELTARETGAQLTCLTISKEQARFATERMAAANVSDRVEIRLEDYRDTRGDYDKIVSIEMFEAVGEENWPVFFDVVRERLTEHGRALLQIITVPDDRFATYRKRVDFIQRYIFPGGMLPSPRALSDAIANAKLELADRLSFGQSYAETLRQWNERFQEAWESIRPLGFDERFRRMWTYYLNSCEGCFRTGATDVGQFLIDKRRA